jgi:hypothetical protein
VLRHEAHRSQTDALRKLSTSYDMISIYDVATATVPTKASIIAWMNRTNP